MFNRNLYNNTSARVNITVDVPSEKGAKAVSLPFKTLVMSEFAKETQQGSLAHRERVPVTRESFDSVIAHFAPTLDLVLKDLAQESRQVSSLRLQFKSLKDFEPDSLMKAVPALRKLVAIRHLIRDLKAHLLDNKALRQKLEQIVKNPVLQKELYQELSPFITKNDELYP